MPPNKHSGRGPSSAARWLSCIPSANLEAQFPSTTNQYAEEGTFAHELCEYKVNKYLHKRGVKRPQSEQFMSEEIEALTDVYLQYITDTVEGMKAHEIEPLVFIETRIEYEHIVPGGFGTADCIIIGGDTIHVIDFKTGGTIVDSYENPQMKLYAIGALRAYGYIYDVTRVLMTIVQPRRENISTFETTVEELERWGEEYVKPRALLSIKGEGDFEPGPHCKYCKAKAVCRACAEEALALAREDFAVLEDESGEDGNGRLAAGKSVLPIIRFRNPGLIDHDELESILPNLTRIQSWINDVFAYVTDEAINHGEVWRGYKIVEGRKTRKFTDPKEVAEAAIAAGYPDVYKQSLISLTEMEKYMKKKSFESVLGKYIEFTKPKLSLVPESDKRPAVDLSGGTGEFDIVTGSDYED